MFGKRFRLNSYCGRLNPLVCIFYKLFSSIYKRAHLRTGSPTPLACNLSQQLSKPRCIDQSVVYDFIKFDIGKIQLIQIEERIYVLEHQAPSYSCTNLPIKTFGCSFRKVPLNNLHLFMTGRKREPEPGHVFYRCNSVLILQSLALVNCIISCYFKLFLMEILSPFLPLSKTDNRPPKNTSGQQRLNPSSSASAAKPTTNTFPRITNHGFPPHNEEITIGQFALASQWAGGAA